MKILIEDICDVCLGEGKPLSGGKCICEGTGKMTSAYHNLRVMWFNIVATMNNPIVHAAIELTCSGDRKKMQRVMEGREVTP